MVLLVRGVEDRAAIALGNTVVIKPSEITPLSILRLGELLLEAVCRPAS